MAEAGNPAMAEVQQQKPAMRLQDRLGKWAKKTFTYEGRVQGEMDARLAKLKPVQEQFEKLPEEKRQALVEQMYAQSRDAATKSIVRDVVVIAGVAGGAGLAYWQKDRLGRVASGAWTRVPEGARRPVERVAARTGDLARRATDPARRFVDWMVRNTAGRLAGNFGWRDTPPYGDWPHVKA